MKTLVMCLILVMTIDFIPYEATSTSTVVSNPRMTDVRARQVLDSALQALGGLDRLQAVTSIMMKGSGREHGSAESQGYLYGQQSNEEYQETLIAFPAQERVAFEHRAAEGARQLRWRKWLYSGDERQVADFLARGRYTRRNASMAAERTRKARRIPHLLLMEAARNHANLQFINGSSMYRGSRHELIAYTPPGEKMPLKLFFDAATHLLSKFEYQMDFPTLGDVVVEYTYSDYRREKRLGWVPTHHAIKVAGNISLEVDVRMAADAREVEEIFQLPNFETGEAGEKFQVPEPLKNLVGMPDTIVEVAAGVYVVELSGFTLLFVEFKDFILAVEAPASHPSLTSIPADNQPGSTSLAEAFIKKIKEKIPDKPIKYLAVTHYHSDHAGGARAFMAESATILTAPGNRRFFEKMAAASYTLIPDRYSRHPRPPSIETFTGKRVITDGARTVELINIGRNPHSQDILIVYIPEQKILFEGDLFYFELGAAFPPKNRVVIMSFFAEWLKSNQLTPERIYSVHNRGFATMEHVNKMLEMSGFSRNRERLNRQRRKS